MAKATRKKAGKPDAVLAAAAPDAGWPATLLVRVLDDVTSGNRSHYARAEDWVGVLAVHGTVLLVVSGWKYVHAGEKLVRVRVHGEQGSTFPILASLTNYLNPLATVVKHEVISDTPPEVRQRPSYGSPSGGGKKKKNQSLF